MPYGVGADSGIWKGAPRYWRRTIAAAASQGRRGRRSQGAGRIRLLPRSGSDGHHDNTAQLPFAGAFACRAC
jgi:hypothetical protein